MKQLATLLRQALWACNLVLADVLDERGTEAARQEAQLLRADVQESQAIEKALQVRSRPDMSTGCMWELPVLRVGPAMLSWWSHRVSDSPITRFTGPM